MSFDDVESALFFKHTLNLTKAQKQLLETTSCGMQESYADTESEATMLLKRIPGTGFNTTTSNFSDLKFVVCLGTLEKRFQVFTCQIHANKASVEKLWQTQKLGGMKKMWLTVPWGNFDFIV